MVMTSLFDNLLDTFFPAPTQKDYALQPAASTPSNVSTQAEVRSKYATLDRITEESEHCQVCDTEIKTMSFKGTGLCSTNCLKAHTGEKPVEAAIAP